LFEWWFAYEAYAPEIFEEGGTIAATGGIAGALFAIVNSVWRARQNQLVTTYGSARWATAKEIKAAGLFTPRGVFLGRLENNYLRHDGPEHVMCFAPTRSGKGVGLVLSTLLSWMSSAVVHDIKDFMHVFQVEINEIAERADVCTENLIRVDVVTESPKLEE
jgi:type IV secretion system protein VirD4